MTDRPASLLDRPDPLSEVFRAVRFTRAIYYTIDTAVPWPPIHVPHGPDIASGLGPRTRTVLSYHIITEGSCWTGLAGGPAVKLERGDVIVYPRGDAYFMAPNDGSPGPAGDPKQLTGLLAGVASGQVPPRFVFVPEAAQRTRFVCGFLGCDPRPFDPLLAALPHMIHTRVSSPRLERLVELAIAEDHGDTVRERLSESMFIETVRQHLATLGSRAGWLASLSDEVVGRALALLHGDPAHPWTLPLLAKKTAVSRTVLADRFTKLVGQPPMQYLTRWRMQTAAQMLRDGRAKVAQVASDVGYASEAAFSRAFKKATGVAPAAWRETAL